jgi:drug/metabolite transporter (DMT)-like permease
MKHAGLLALLINPAVIIGILLLIGWMLFRMTLLSITPMSLILPLTAGAAYLLTGAAGRIVLHDRVGSEYGWGLLLIVIGVVLIGSSASKHPPGLKR